MNKVICILPLALLVTGCGKTQLTPQLYMPTPPAVLMQKPKDLNTIRNDNLTITDEAVIVEAPKK